VKVTECSSAEVSFNCGCEEEHREVESGSSGSFVKRPARLLVALTAKLSEAISDELIGSSMGVAVDTSHVFVGDCTGCRRLRHDFLALLRWMSTRALKGKLSL
jgi:hypothetical protein